MGYGCTRWAQKPKWAWCALHVRCTDRPHDTADDPYATYHELDYSCLELELYALDYLG